MAFVAQSCLESRAEKKDRIDVNENLLLRRHHLTVQVHAP